MKNLLLLFALGAFSGPTQASAWELFHSNQSVMRNECGETIKKRLKSPSSYREISASEMIRRPATLDEHRGLFTAEQVEASAELARADYRYRDLQKAQAETFTIMKPDFVQIVLTYEASNSYGVMLRETAICASTVPTGEDFDKLAAMGPAINGETHFQWLLRAQKGAAARP